MEVSSPSTFSALLFLPVLEEQNLEDTLHTLSNAEGITIKCAIITNTLVGELCYRTLDNDYSEQAYVLQKDLKVKLQNKINYRERERYYGARVPMSQYERHHQRMGYEEQN